MKPIDFDELFKRKYFNNESDSTSKFNEPTYEPVSVEDIMEEAYENTEKLDRK